jgi:DNA polymerase III alpha subunit
MARNDATVLVHGRTEISDEGSITVFVDKILELEQAIQQKARELTIRLPANAESGELYEAIKKLLEKQKGDCDVYLELISEGALIRMRAHPSLKVAGSSGIESDLRELGCEVRWEGYSSSIRAAAASGNA